MSRTEHDVGTGTVPRPPRPDEPAQPAGPAEPAEPADQDLAAALRLAIGRLARRIRQEHHGTLTPSQHSALVSVEQLAPVRLGDLATAEGISAPTLTKIVAALEEAGLVQRATDEADRRSSLLQLTDQGRATLHAIRTERTAFLRRQLDRLGEADRRRLAAALPVLACARRGRPELSTAPPARGRGMAHPAVAPVSSGHADR